MAADTKFILLSEWFNNQFTQLVNSRISNPPYNNNFEDVIFFLFKRYWITNYINVAWENVKDIIEYTDLNWTYYMLATETATNVKVYKIEINLSLTLKLDTAKWKFTRFEKLTMWWWTISDSWTASSWSATQLVDATKSWVLNAYAWYYVYIKTWTAAWQLRIILSNT
jgi:hypothetical protein